MSSVVFPLHAEDLTPGLLTAALAERHPEARVESLRVVDQAHCKSGSASTAARASLSSPRFARRLRGPNGAGGLLRSFAGDPAELPFELVDSPPAEIAPPPLPPVLPSEI